MNGFERTVASMRRGFLALVVLAFVAGLAIGVMVGMVIEDQIKS